VESTLDRLHSQYGVHPCGEGGEYETFVLDCPLFHKRILVEDSEVGVSPPTQFYEILKKLTLL
ncbi:hypothetical protein ANCDUO_26181, partial [Ancylostoma duodenale]